jgi:hypothetical protein
MRTSLIRKSLLLPFLPSRQGSGKELLDTLRASLCEREGEEVILDTGTLIESSDDFHP